MHYIYKIYTEWGGKGEKEKGLIEQNLKLYLSLKTKSEKSSKYILPECSCTINREWERKRKTDEDII